MNVIPDVSTYTCLVMSDFTPRTRDVGSLDNSYVTPPF